MQEIILEIVNPMGTVSYRRPQGHPDVAEALRTTGYSVRFTLPASAPRGGPEAWATGCRIAGLPENTMQRSDEYSFGLNRDTGRMYIWARWYTPTPQEYAAARDWAYPEGWQG